MRALAAFVAGATLFAASAAAAPFPTRSGESGLLDVPDAETIGARSGLVGAELRYDHVQGRSDDFGPFPFSVGAGLTPGIDLGLSARDGGQPGDPKPARLMFGAAAKLKLLPSGETLPGVALDFTVDRFNESPVLGSRLLLSTAPRGTLRLIAFGGLESRASDLSLSPTYGGALAIRHRSETELVVEGLQGPQGANLGAALRWTVTKTYGVSLGVNYLPKDQAFRVSFGLGFGPSPRQTAQAQPESPAAVAAGEEQPEETNGAAAQDERPRFRMKIRRVDPHATDPRPEQFAAYVPRGVASASTLPSRAAAKPAAPAADEILEGQVREAESQVDARERRVSATADGLSARDAANAAEARRLSEREQGIAAREAQLEARERRVTRRSAPSDQERQLQSVEAQLSSRERQLQSQERGLAPEIEAAQGRESDAATREDVERKEANRLAAAATSAPLRAQQLELRRQATAARSRLLAASEARLVAMGERIDAVERQLQTRSERLDGWQRRLDARAERLDLVERRAATAATSPEPLAPPPADLSKDAGAQKDKAVFVMVVKSPTAVVKEKPAAAAAPAPAPAAVHAGVAVEKAVAAATVVAFASPSATLGELDREAVENVAKLAAKEGCELLVWARAKTPALMAEAQRRAAEIKTRVIAAGPLDEARVVTRITTRPGATGVDVVVSALREGASPAAKAPGASTVPGASETQSGGAVTGESGRRQIREAVVAAQPSIEACIADTIEKRHLSRAEGVLKLTVAGDGRVAHVAAGGADLGGAEMDACLAEAARAWKFPGSDGEYVVDVPITIVRGGTAP